MTCFACRTQGTTYVFVDEVTLLADFIDNAALFSDVFVVEGMRIVLTGGDSLGFWFASREELYDRCVFIHTTHVPFHEHARLLGTEDIDEYLEYGGTLRMADSGLSDPYSYDGDAEVTFATYEATRRYVDTAIVCNIQNSLSFYQGGRHFRHLRELYVADELTSAIKGVIEDVNHGFVADVLRCRLSSHDLGSARQLASRARDPERRTDVLDHIDTEAVTAQLMECSTYWTRTGKRSPSQTPMPRRIREYLEALDLLAHVPTETATGGPIDCVIFTQPGMRYAQAKALVQALMASPALAATDRRLRRLVRDTVLSDVRGRMLEDVILFETMRALPPFQEAFKLEFAARGVRHGHLRRVERHLRRLRDQALPRAPRRTATVPARRCVRHRMRARGGAHQEARRALSRRARIRGRRPL